MKKAALMKLLSEVDDDATVVFCRGDMETNATVVRIGSVTEEMLTENYIEDYPEGESGYEKALVLWA